MNSEHTISKGIWNRTFCAYFEQDEAHEPECSHESSRHSWHDTLGKTLLGDTLGRHYWETLLAWHSWEDTPGRNSWHDTPDMTLLGDSWHDTLGKTLLRRHSWETLLGDTLGTTLLGRHSWETLLGRHSWKDTLGRTLLGRHSWKDTLGKTLLGDTLGMTLLGRHSWEDTLGKTLLEDTPVKTLLGDTLGMTLLTWHSWKDTPGRHSWETLLGDTPGMTLLGGHSWHDTLGKTLLGRHSWEDTLGRTLLGRLSWEGTLGKTLLDTLGRTLLAWHSSKDTLRKTLLAWQSWKDTLGKTLLGDTLCMTLLERHSWHDTLGKTLLGRHSWETLLGDTLGKTLLGRHSWETLLGRHSWETLLAWHSWEDTLGRTLLGRRSWETLLAWHSSKDTLGMTLLGRHSWGTLLTWHFHFHHLSKNATLSKEFARFHHLTQPWQCDSHKSHISTRLKCCSCHAKWYRRCPKCCACHESLQLIFCEPFKSIAPVTQNNVRHVLQTQDNVTKSLACHAKHDFHILWNGQKRQVLQLSLLARGRHHTTIASSLDTSKAQNEHFVRDFLHFSHFVPEKSTFSFEFSHEAQNLPRQNRCFVRGFRQFSSLVQKNIFHGICTFSPVDAALTMRFAQKSHLHTSKVCACHAKWHRRCPKCCACHELKCNASSENVTKVLRLPHKTTLDTSWNMLECHEVPCLPRKTTWAQLLTRRKGHFFYDFSHRHGNFSLTTVLHILAPHTRGMSQSATPATQNDMSTSSDTSKQCHEVPCLPRKTRFPHPVKRTKKTSFAAFPIGTGTPPHNHSIKPRHIESSKRAFRTRLPPLFTLCTWKIDVFLRVFSWSAKFATSKSMFRARLPSIFITCPKNTFHRIRTFSPVDAALTMRFAQKSHLHTSKVLRLPRKMTSEVSKVLRLPRIKVQFWKCSKSIAPATQNDFWHVMKHVGMPRSATPATQNGMTTASDTSEKSRFCDYSHRHGHTALTRTVADGCERMRTVADGCERLRT